MCTAFLEPGEYRRRVGVGIDRCNKRGRQAFINGYIGDCLSGNRRDQDIGHVDFYFPALLVFFPSETVKVRLSIPKKSVLGV